MKNAKLVISLQAVAVGASGLLMAALMVWIPRPVNIMAAMFVWVVGLFSLQASALKSSRRTARLVAIFQVLHAVIWAGACVVGLAWPGWTPALWVGGGLMTLAGAVVGHLIFHEPERSTAAPR